MTSIKWISSLAVAAAVSLVSLPSGAADSAADGPTRAVRAWDLDLSRPQDVQTLYRRVQNAAEKLCRSEAHDHWVATRRRPPVGWVDDCVTTAVDKAVRDTGDPVLAALHISTGVAQRD
jgi:UrcA family protein